MNDEDARFIDSFAERAARIPGVQAVALGGSRAQGLETAESDFDFAIYYRGSIDTADIRAVGWQGDVFEPGEWGGGVMNGGAFLTVDNRRVDLHYRDLNDVERWSAEAEQGRFQVERLPFYLAGIPTYVLMAELAVAKVLSGTLPRPSYPVALQRAAPPFWNGAAQLSMSAARGFAVRSMEIEALGNVARAAIEVAHARMAGRRMWVLNEKRLIDAAGLAGAREELAATRQRGDSLVDAVAALGRAIGI